MSAYFLLEFVSVHVDDTAPGIAANALIINVTMVISIIKVNICTKLYMSLINLISETSFIKPSWPGIWHSAGAVSPNLHYLPKSTCNYHLANNKNVHVRNKSDIDDDPIK